MIRRILGALVGAVLCSSVALAVTNVHQPSAADMSKSPSVSAPVSKITGKPPIEVVESAPVGTLHNPFTGQADKIAEGRKLFFGYSCNGCHGGGGGGGMCPSIKNDIWVYGSDDDTVFRLITLGSDNLQKKGYVRQGMETIVGPMPPMGTLMKSDEELFKIMAFIRSLYTGPKDRVNW